MFTVRVKKAEKARFEALAAAAGQSLTAWARRTLLVAADRQEGRPGGFKGGGKGSGGRRRGGPPRADDGPAGPA